MVIAASRQLCFPPDAAHLEHRKKTGKVHSFLAGKVRNIIRWKITYIGSMCDWYIYIPTFKWILMVNLGNYTPYMD